MQGWEEEGVETENDDKTCEGERRREKGKWILQPSVKTHKRIIQCSSSSSSFPGGGCLFFLNVCLAVSTGLALLPKGFPLRSHGQRTRENTWVVRPPDGCMVGAASLPSPWAARSGVAPQALRGDGEGLLAL